MIGRRPGLLACAVSLCLAFGLAGTAWSQHTPDPYNIVGEYNRQYEPFMYANVPNTPGMVPNQERLEPRSGVRGANRFQSYLDSDGEELDDLGRSSFPRGGGGAGTPYWRANRQFDREFNRTYRPNGRADETFYDEQKKRNAKYFEALQQTDPRKRAQLLREYNLENLRSARSLSGGRGVTERDREREIGRDRGALGGLPPSLDDEPLPLDTRRSSTGAVAPRRRTAPGTSAPLPSGRSNSLTPAGRAPARTAPRTGAPPAAGSRALPGTTTAPRTDRSASDILQRNDVLDRAYRVLSQDAPAGTSPAQAPRR